MKFKVLKSDLMQWNETEFGNVSTRKQKLWRELNDAGTAKTLFFFNFILEVNCIFTIGPLEFILRYN